MKIAVAGLGYVGLANAVLLAQKHQVIAVDVVQEKVDLVNERRSPIRDSEIEEFFEKVPLNLYATTDSKEAYKTAEWVIVATPTNYDPDRNFFDTSYVESVIQEVQEVNPQAMVVIKSTIPVGYTENICRKYHTSSILFSPEFLREGKALYDNLFPSRIIVGITEKNDYLKQKAGQFITMLKEGARKPKIDSLIMGTTEAEAVKLFSNTYLALRVAYFNELDTYAETRGLNSREIIEGVGLDPRIGQHYNNPSFGYGGYCLPKDTKQLLANFAQIPENIITAIVDANRTRKDYIAGNILNQKPKVVGIYRIAMKADSDNYRQSSMLGIIERLQDSDVEIIIYEPMLTSEEFLGCEVISSLEELKERSDMILANRFPEALRDVEKKVYTRDLYHRD